MIGRELWRKKDHSSHLCLRFKRKNFSKYIMMMIKCPMHAHVPLQNHIDYNLFILIFYEESRRYRNFRPLSLIIKVSYSLEIPPLLLKYWHFSQDAWLLKMIPNLYVYTLIITQPWGLLSICRNDPNVKPIVLF